MTCEIFVDNSYYNEIKNKYESVAFKDDNFDKDKLKELNLKFFDFLVSMCLNFIVL